MARVRVGEIALGYEVAGGAGPPLLLLAGQGATRRMWVAQRPLAACARLYLLDSRGVGESDRPAGLYDGPQMAEDVRGFMDAMGLESAHVLGLEMGGIVAQELAIRWPDRIRSLMLAGTFPRSSSRTRMLMQLGAELESEAGAPVGEDLARAAAHAWIPSMFSPGFWPAEVPELIRNELIASYVEGFSLDGLSAQGGVVLAHDALARLGRITAPTLVLHGTEDRVVMFRHGEDLAAAIPGAQLLRIEGAPHALFAERAEELNAAVRTWIADVEEERAAGGSAEPVEIPIDGTLDLHTFRPDEVKDLLEDYIEACRARGIYELRVIHGKGTGALRRTVHALLERRKDVAAFGPCDERSGGWGATRVVLRRRGPGSR